jgi:hypothetical protein
MKKPQFKFVFYVSRYNGDGFHLTIFSENEQKALVKAKQTVTGDKFTMQSVEEVQNTRLVLP